MRGRERTLVDVLLGAGAPTPGRVRRLGVERICLGLLAITSCAGPPALDRAILPAHESTDRGAVRAQPERLHGAMGALVAYPTGQSTATPSFREVLSNEPRGLLVTYLPGLDIDVRSETG